MKLLNYLHRHNKTGTRPVLLLFVAGPGIEGQVSKLASSLRTSSPNSSVAGRHDSVCSSPSRVKLFTLLLHNTRKPTSEAWGFQIVLRGPESNRGLEVMSLPRCLSSTPLFVYWFQFVSRATSRGYESSLLFSLSKQKTLLS